jgi:hypothetical protein
MRWIAWMGLLAACEPMPATGDPLAPVRAPAPAAVQASGPKTPAPATPSPASDGEFDFGEDEGTDAPETEVPDDPATLLALAQGKPPPDPSRVAPVPAPAPAPPVVGAPVGPAAMGIAALPWDPATAPALDWGVHLVSTLVDTQPPMAVLGLPDGSKLVVQPGSFLPEHRLVVLAIGRDVAQVARVIPEGYAARIETRTISSLFPGAAARPPVTP